MNQWQGPGDSWNVSPGAYHARVQRKAARFQRRHGIQPKRIRPNRVGRIVSAPFRLLWFLVKLLLVFALIAVAVVGLVHVVSGLG